MKQQNTKKYLKKRIAAGSLSAVMAGVSVFSLLPENVLAVTGSEVAADGTYTSSSETVTVSRRNTYVPTIIVTVQDGKISDITGDPNTTNEDNLDYFDQALSGIKENLSGKYATVNNVDGVDSVSGATLSSAAIKADLAAALGQAEVNQNVQVEDQEFTISRAQADNLEEIYAGRKASMDDAAIWKADPSYSMYYLTASSSSAREFTIPASVKKLQGSNTSYATGQTILNSRHLDGVGDTLIFDSGSHITVSDFLFGARANRRNPINVLVKSGAAVTFQNCTFEGALTIEDDATVTFDNCKVSYELSFDANGGSNAPGKITGTLTGNTETDSVKLPEDILTRDGYTFEGYAEAKDATEAQYHAGDTITLDQSHATRTLYAVWKEASEPVIEDTYVLMNIPYDKFYEADGLSADVVTSATKQKSKRDDVVGGSYRMNADGSEINGVTFPVKVSSLSLLSGETRVTDETTSSVTIEGKKGDTTKEYTGKDSLFVNPSYAYYVLSETPDYYKILSVNADGTYSFGKIWSKKTNQITSSAELDSGSAAKHGGDYEITLKDYEDKAETIYGAIMHTQEGENYALRHLENIWKPGTGEFGFSVGHVTEIKDNTVSWQPFKDAEGQTVTGFTVYSNNGIDEITLDTPLKLVSFSKQEASAQADNESAVLIQNLPSDAQNVSAYLYFENEAGDKEYVIEKKSPEKVENGKLSLPEGKTLTEGTTYTIRIFSDNYATQDIEFTYSKKNTAHSGGGGGSSVTPTPTPTPAAMPFTDVKSSAFYYDAVKWAVDNKVTEGTTATTFSPNEGCTRGQMIQFLYNLAGKPAVSGTMPFTDVSDDAFYHDAVLWAYQNGITAGTTATTFSPNLDCSRSYMVQFLYSRAGKPAVTGAIPFTDVSTDKYYYNAVVWAYQNGVTAGTTATTFSPDQTCTRGQMVQFLYKASKI